jgi:hypothetical protein
MQIVDVNILAVGRDSRACENRRYVSFPVFSTLAPNDAANIPGPKDPSAATVSWQY